MKKGFLMKSVAVLASVIISIGCFTQTQNYNLETSAATVSQLEKQKKANAAKQAQLKKDIESNKNNLSAAEQQQKNVQAQIDLTEENIRLINSELEALTANIETLEASVVTQQEDINQGITDFKKRLLTMYVAGEDTMASVLVGSSDFYDLLAKTEMVKRVAKRDDDLIADLNAKMTQLNIDKAEVEQEKSDTQVVKSELDTNMVTLNETYEQSQTLIAKRKAEAEAIKKDQVAVEKEEEAIEAEIQRLIREAAAKAAKAAADAKASAAVKAAQKYVGGVFTWPMPGYYYISSPHGTRTLYGVTKTHKGVDIAGSGIHGKSIIAANGGNVIVAESTFIPGYSYGKYVMIDHGGGFVTLYGHMSAVAVKVGQTVTKGQQIGNVGNTGNSFGSHLHFEIRIGGIAKDPMTYFNKG